MKPAPTPTPPTPGEGLIVVSNGHGEDTVACRILERLVPLLPAGSPVSAWAMVGRGTAYRDRGIPVSGPSNLLPGEGFSTIDARLFWRDLRAGFIATHLAQWRHAGGMRGSARLLLGVGDIMPLLVAWRARLPMAFVAIAKSAHYGGREARTGGHWPSERFLMRRWCTDVFARDTLSAEGLAARGIPALAPGNPMMDGLDPPPVPLLPPATPAVAVLPGSRADAADNARFVLDAALAHDAGAAGQGRAPAFLFALTPAVPVPELAARACANGWNEVTAAGLPEGARALVAPGGTRAMLLPGAFAAVLHASQVAIGLAGTANEQAAGLGLPLLTAPGAGNQGAAYLRMKMRFFGPAAEAVPRDPRALAQALARLLADPERRARMGAEGRRRMGGPGGSQAIAEAVARRYRELGA